MESWFSDPHVADLYGCDVKYVQRMGQICTVRKYITCVRYAPYEATKELNYPDEFELRSLKGSEQISNSSRDRVNVSLVASPTYKH